MLAGEYPQVSRWLVFTWDGTGLARMARSGAARRCWAGPGQWQRVASLRPFRLPGGEKAGREPWRSAAALAWEAGLDWQPDGFDVSLARAAWMRDVNSPVSSAAGRVFDACAALAGVMQRTSYEAQAPMVWEALCHGRILPEATESLPLARDAAGILRMDWAPLLAHMADASVSRAERSARMHAVLAESLVAQAMAIREAHGGFAVGLSGGVFLNRVLVERVMQRLEAQGFAVYLPERIPCNDAGLSFGQIIEGGLP
jgi:hydrogenase maturation protein HypF